MQPHHAPLVRLQRRQIAQRLRTNQRAERKWLAGDQQLGGGLLMAAVVGAMAGRLVLDRPIYHALADLQRAPRREKRM